MAHDINYSHYFLLLSNNIVIIMVMTTCVHICHHEYTPNNWSIRKLSYILWNQPITTKSMGHDYTETRNERIGGFYKGLGPSLLRVVPASAITFVVYESSLEFFRNETG